MALAGSWFGARIHLNYALGHPPPPLPRQPRPKLHRSRPKLQPTDRSNANFIAMSVALRDGRGAVGRAASGVVGKARMRRLLLVRPRPSVAPGSSGVSHTGTRRSLAAGGTRRGCKTCVRPATRTSTLGVESLEAGAVSLSGGFEARRALPWKENPAHGELIALGRKAAAAPLLSFISSKLKAGASLTAVH